MRASLTGQYALHLTVVGSDPISVGRYGCDYSWNADFTAYRCLPHRWLPGSDSSYAAWQSDDTALFAADEVAEEARGDLWPPGTPAESPCFDADANDLPF